MTSILKTSAILLVLHGVATAPAVGQDRLPRAGAPTGVVTVTEAAPAVRKPRSGSPVTAAAPASTEIAFDASGAGLLGATTGETGLVRCGHKYCGGAGR